MLPNYCVMALTTLNLPLPGLLTLLSASCPPLLALVPPPGADTVYLCMYSAVILNGDLRNPAIKPAWKMTR